MGNDKRESRSVIAAVRCSDIKRRLVKFKESHQETFISYWIIFGGWNGYKI